LSALSLYQFRTVTLSGGFDFFFTPISLLFGAAQLRSAEIQIRSTMPLLWFALALIRAQNFERFQT